MLLAALVFFAQVSLAEPLPTGHYEKACARFEEDDFLTATLQIGADGAWLRSRTAYEEESCATPWIEFREEGKVAGRRGDELDLRMASVGYRPLTAEVAEALNISAFCGETTWRAGVLLDVSGRECGDYPVPARGATVYSRARLEENSLRLAEDSYDHDGTSPARRHERLEDAPYRRVTGAIY